MGAGKEMNRGKIRKELKKQLTVLFKSMDFVSNNFLDSEKTGKKVIKLDSIKLILSSTPR